MRDSDFWRAGSAVGEARVLFRLLKNGDDAQSLRQVISVSPTELAELKAWAASSSPAVAVGIDNMLRFRSKALAEFNRLVSGVNNG